MKLHKDVPPTYNHSVSSGSKVGFQGKFFLLITEFPNDCIFSTLPWSTAQTSVVKTNEHTRLMESCSDNMVCRDRSKLWQEEQAL